MSPTSPLVPPKSSCRRRLSACTGMLAILVLWGTAAVSQRGPATVVGQIGVDDQRISFMGPDGHTGFSGQISAVAYDSTNHEYLVVWTGDTLGDGVIQNEREIWAQRVDADTGESLGGLIRVSDMGTDETTDGRASGPEVAYNPTVDEYLVVWQGSDTGASPDPEEEIYGQRLEGGTGVELGTNDFRISFVGTDGDSSTDGRNPDVVYNPDAEEYLVVWLADDTGLADNEFEVFARRVDGATGALLGTGAVRVSQMGTDLDPNYRAFSPAVAYNPTDDLYLVVWNADTDAGDLVNGELEIWGQGLEGADSTENGVDFRISDMGVDGDPASDATSPDVAYDPVANRFLVVWQGTDGTPPLANGESEIWGQFVGPLGTEPLAEVGTDFRVSYTGVEGDASQDATQPSLIHAATDGEFLVVFRAEDDGSAPLTADDLEIYARRIDAATGNLLGDDFPLSSVGPPDSDAFQANQPAIAIGPNREALVVWHGDDNRAPLVDNELEIFGQRVRWTEDWIDAAISVSDGVTEVVPGEVLTYTVAVENLESSFEDPAVQVVDEFPAELTCSWTSVAADGATGNGSGSGPVLDETLSMPSGSSVTYTIDCTIDPAAQGTLSNTATVTPSFAELQPIDNTSTDDDTQLPLFADGFESGGTEAWG